MDISRVQDHIPLPLDTVNSALFIDLVSTALCEGVCCEMLHSSKAFVV